MKNVFSDTRALDKTAREKFFLTEELMMENAAQGLEACVMPHVFHESARYISRPCVLILAGRGNNGADGYALARRLSCHDFSVAVCCIGGPVSEIAAVQKKRAELLGATFVSAYDLDSFVEEKSFDICIVVDCIYGSGFHLPLDAESEAVINCANKIEAFKVSCDVPSGLDSAGNGKTVFRADETVVMGALKLSLFSDKAKDFCGRLSVCNLGISRNNFEFYAVPAAFLLEKDEMKLPVRKMQNVNKGTFGHVAVAAGEKTGAARIAASAAFAFGAGLATIAGIQDFGSMDIMASKEIPGNTTALALGCGFGRKNSTFKKYFTFLTENKNIPCVLDADIFYYREILSLLEERGNFVLTPHPKEFSVLLENCGLGKFSVEKTVEDRLALARLFCGKFKESVLVLKGAVTLVGMWSESDGRVKIYFDPYGENCLAKGGTGDVLAGLAASLLAQGYSCADAAVTAVLAHSFASKKVKSSFSLTPRLLIEKISEF